MSLKNLPNELILLVFQQIDDTTALQAVACACKKFREIAEICLYSLAIFTRRSSSDKLLSICQKESRLGCYVHDLQLLYSTRHYDFLETQSLDLHRFPCLNSFVSESPFCNAHSRVTGSSDSTWKLDMHAYLRAFEKASLLSPIPHESKPLRSLRSLTLHWSAGNHQRFWQTTPLCPIFLMPELRVLSISCVKIKAARTESELDRFKKQTRLDSLKFVESIVSPNALEQILSLQKHLKSFTLREINYHPTETLSYTCFNDDIQASERALAQQSESLQSFDFSGRRVRDSQFPRGLDFSVLHSLRYLRLNDSQCKAWRLPPTLQTICIEDLSPRLLRTGIQPSLSKIIKLNDCIKSCSKRNAVFQLDLVFERLSAHHIAQVAAESDEDGDVTIRRIFDNFRDNMINVYRFGREKSPETETPMRSDDDDDVGIITGGQSTSFSESMSAVPVRLRVLSSKRGGYIPPYLHGEKGPIWDIRYDSEMLESLL